MGAEGSNVGTQNQLKQIEIFRNLHKPGNPLVLYNIWDAGSAKVVANSGAKAIATSSWAVARAHGFSDGERIPLELALANLQRIVSAVDLPVSVDLESGYGDTPDQVARSISQAIRAGAVGCNLEDSSPATGAVRDIALQADRIRAARKASEAVNIPFFLNARCDLFFQQDSIPHDEKLLVTVVERANVYAEAGADGLFVPGLANISLIAELAKKVSLPLNILADATTSIQNLADIGVARVSYGATPYVEASSALEKAAHASQLLGSR